MTKLDKKPDFYTIKKVVEPYPVAFITFHKMPRKEVEVEEFNYFMLKMDKLFDYYHRHTPGRAFAIVFDTQVIQENPNRLFMDSIHEWMDRNRERITRRLRCTGVLVKSRLIQAFLAVLFKLKATARDAKSFRSNGEGLAVDRCMKWIQSVKVPQGMKA